jgi:hypothetical protein
MAKVLTLIDGLPKLRKAIGIRHLTARVELHAEASMGSRFLEALNLSSKFLA